MGDRTNAIIKFPVTLLTGEQTKKAIEILQREEGVSCTKDDLPELGLEDVNNGAANLINSLCDASIPFHIQWGSGSEYNAGCTVSDGKQEYHVLWDCIDGGILVHLDARGNAYPKSIDNAKAYLAMKKRIQLL